MIGEPWVRHDDLKDHGLPIWGNCPLPMPTGFVARYGKPKGWQTEVVSIEGPGFECDIVVNPDMPSIATLSAMLRAVEKRVRA